MVQQRFGNKCAECGYTTMLLVLVVGFAGLAMALSIIWYSAGASKTSILVDQSAQAHAAADACIEAGLFSVGASSLCAGSGSIEILIGASCSYTVTGGSPCLIAATGTVGTVVSKIQASLSSVDPVVLARRRDVADF